MTAENALSLALFCVAERALCYLRRQAQPSCVETVKVAGKLLAPGIDLLQPQKDELPQARNFEILDGEAVKLVSVDRQVLPPGETPLIFLVHPHAYQVRHDFRQPVVVIPFNPDHLDPVLWVGKLADEPEKSPMLFGQAAEIQVGEDIAQQDQPAKACAFKELQRIGGPADLRSQVQVGNNHRVKVVAPHAPSL
jgi:hypothetical protein